MKRRFLSESAVERVRERDAARDEDPPENPLVEAQIDVVAPPNTSCCERGAACAPGADVTLREPLGEGVESEVEPMEPPNTSTACAKSSLARDISEEGGGVPSDVAANNVVQVKVRA